MSNKKLTIFDTHEKVCFKYICDRLALGIKSLVFSSVHHISLASCCSLLRESTIALSTIGVDWHSGQQKLPPSMYNVYVQKTLWIAPYFMPGN